MSKSIPSYKVGDRAVIISENDGFISKERGKSYGDGVTINSVGTHDIFGHYLYVCTGCNIPFTEDELVSEEIWNSGLFQVMKELEE